jgi:N-formylglutamate amidohydrolase
VSHAQPFTVFGASPPSSPVILSVPHAGRIYPEAFAQLARVPAERLRALEDRYADRLIGKAVRHGIPAIVQNVARAWIDLNRSEREFDPALIAGVLPVQPLGSAKVRGGLGVIPRRIASAGDIWRGALSAAHFEDRLNRYHRPYHAALAEMIDAAVARFGVAILIDIHSMPALSGSCDAAAPPRIVVGDLFGRSAANRFAEAAVESLARSGEGVALNTPYAGGHILDRHGRPERGVHALQIEFDRTLYLHLSEPSSGLAALDAAVLTVVRALENEALATPLPLAAE